MTEFLIAMQVLKYEPLEVRSQVVEPFRSYSLHLPVQLSASGNGLSPLSGRRKSCSDERTLVSISHIVVRKSLAVLQLVKVY